MVSSSHPDNTDGAAAEAVTDDGARQVLRFADYAAQAGWTEGALASFCLAQGINADKRAALWPRGIRSLGHCLNDDADRRMTARWDAVGARTLGEVMAARFEDNAALKPAVRRLAASDLLHPLDTLMRTYRTARRMWRCRAERIAPEGVSGVVLTWWLVGLYSLCVLVWLTDRSVTQALTARAVTAAGWLAGDR